MITRQDIIQTAVGLIAAAALGAFLAVIEGWL